VVAYNASFEKRCLQHLADNVPSQRAALKSVIERLVDLLPIVRDHVYHPDFGGSFSMKKVTPALVPGLGYEDLDIADGGTAQAVLEGLLLGNEDSTLDQRRSLRQQLLDYCERDSVAMVRIVQRLSELAGLQR
jgi:predicted RecB family nuclease